MRSCGGRSRRRTGTSRSGSRSVRRRGVSTFRPRRRPVVAPCSARETTLLSSPTAPSCCTRRSPPRSSSRSGTRPRGRRDALAQPLRPRVAPSDSTPIRARPRPRGPRARRRNRRCHSQGDPRPGDRGLRRRGLAGVRDPARGVAVPRPRRCLARRPDRSSLTAPVPFGPSIVSGGATAAYSLRPAREDPERLEVARRAARRPPGDRRLRRDARRRPGPRRLWSHGVSPLLVAHGAERRCAETPPVGGHPGRVPARALRDASRGEGDRCQARVRPARPGRPRLLRRPPSPHSASRPSERPRRSRLVRGGKGARALCEPVRRPRSTDEGSFGPRDAPAPARGARVLDNGGPCGDPPLPAAVVGCRVRRARRAARRDA